MKKEDYRSAFRAALALLATDAREGQAKLLEVARSLYAAGAAATSTKASDFIGALSLEELSQLLTAAREWNTRAKHAPLVQALLRDVFAAFDPRELAKMPRARELLDGLIAYNERHYARSQRAVQDSYLLDFALSKIGMLSVD